MLIVTLGAIASLALAPSPTNPATYQSPDRILAAAPSSDWQPLDPANTLYMTLPAGRVVIAMAPAFAPRTVANIVALVQSRYFDQSSILRTQDNYVVQWSQNDARKSLPPKGYVEFERKRSATFMPLPDPDGYAAEAGFDGGLPAASDGKQEWLAHCYGMVGAGRDTAPDSGTGVELYAVIGQAPRHLDRNITLVGRVVEGIELLSSLTRGSGPLGFYEKPEQYTKIASIRLGSDLPPDQRSPIEVLRTDSKSFENYVESRRNRHDAWFMRPAGHIDVCNIPIPVRRRQS